VGDRAAIGSIVRIRNRVGLFDLAAVAAEGFRGPRSVSANRGSAEGVLVGSDEPLATPARSAVPTVAGAGRIGSTPEDSARRPGALRLAVIAACAARPGSDAS
jgi:hypothetical protein